MITMVPEEGFPKFDARKMAGNRDFVIVTDGKLPRSGATAKKE